MHTKQSFEDVRSQAEPGNENREMKKDRPDWPVLSSNKKSLGTQTSPRRFSVRSRCRTARCMSGSTSGAGSTL